MDKQGSAPVKEKFWGWCECECILCDHGDHGMCKDTKLCGMPKTFDKNEKPRPR
jgi:hypothetical protein